MQNLTEWLSQNANCRIINIIPVSIAVCNQKGGVGKSSLTVLLASYLHYTLGHDVLVMDCDYPQWSVHAQRERELSVLENSKYYKLMLIRQFKATGRKLWPIIACTPAEAPERESRFLRDSGYRPAIVLYDLPGTVNTAGVIEIFSALDYLFVPMKADKVVMGSTLSFARTFDLSLVQNQAVHLKDIRLFWIMLDRRERTPLYEQYETLISQLGLSLLQTHIPYRSKFNKELLPDGTGVGRSTLLAPERTFAQEAQIEALADEILSILKIR